MAHSKEKVSTLTLRVARKSTVVASLCVLMLIAGIVHPSYAYGDTLSDAKAQLAAAQKELTAANNAFASLKATKAKIDTVNSQANSSTGITNDFAFSGQKAFYVPVNGNKTKPAGSTLVGVEGTYVNGNSDGWTQQKVIDYINQVRRDAYNAGLVSQYTPVTWSKNLERTAQIRAAEISIYGDHTRPSGEDWFGIGDEGLMPGYAENLSWGGSYYTNIKMWVDEKEDYRKYLNCSKGQTSQCNYGVYGHYRNLVNPQLSAVGLAQFNSDRSTINPYSTAMAAEFSYSATGSQSKDVKAVNNSVYQGVYVKSSAVGSIGAAGATTFNISAVAGDPVWTRATPVKEAKAFAKSQASAEWSRIQSSYNAKKAVVDAAQKKVNTAQAKVDKLQPKSTKTTPSSTKTQTATKSGTASSSSTSSKKTTTSSSSSKKTTTSSSSSKKTTTSSSSSKKTTTSTAVQRVNVYRMYNPATSEHLYTMDTKERDALVARHGWKYEGVAWIAPSKSSTPVYRLYNAGLGDHHYTKDVNEVRVLTTRAGWVNEGIKWYSADTTGKPVYRAYNYRLTVGQHHYTPDANEINALITRFGWKNEAIAWYGMK